MVAYCINQQNTKPRGGDRKLTNFYYLFYGFLYRSLLRSFILIISLLYYYHTVVPLGLAKASESKAVTFILFSIRLVTHFSWDLVY